MATTETKYQTDFYSAKNTNIQPNFNKGFLKILIKYQANTKKFGTEIPNTDLVRIGIFLVYQIFWLPIDITTLCNLCKRSGPEPNRKSVLCIGSAV